MKYFSTVKTFSQKQYDKFLIYIELYHRRDSLIYMVATCITYEELMKRGNETRSAIGWIEEQLSIIIKPQLISNALTKLGELAEEYIGWIAWKDSSKLKSSCKLLGLARYGLPDQFIKIKDEMVDSSNSKVISIWDEHYKMLANFYDYYFGISSSENSSLNEFNQILSSFIKSTTIISQVLSVEVKNRERLLAESWENYQPFLNSFKDNKTELSEITKTLFLLNSNQDRQSYKNLKEIIYSKEIEKYSRFIQYTIVTYNSLFLVGKIKQGEVLYGQELLDLYEFSLNKQIFNLNDTMSLIKFINLIGVASKLGRIEWARKIVNNWAHKVDTNNHKSVAKFGHATIDFHEKKFENVIVTLSNLKSSSFQHKLRFRWLLLIAQYELNKEYVNVIKAQVDNFRRFISSNKSRTNKPTYLALKSSIRIIGMLLKKRPQNQILNFYDTCQFIYERKWILSKINNQM